MPSFLEAPVAGAYHLITSLVSAIEPLAGPPGVEIDGDGVDAVGVAHLDEQLRAGEVVVLVAAHDLERLVGGVFRIEREERLQSQ